jgi:hypothetical protein
MAGIIAPLSAAAKPELHELTEMSLLRLNSGKAGRVNSQQALRLRAF